MSDTTDADAYGARCRRMRPDRWRWQRRDPFDAQRHRAGGCVHHGREFDRSRVHHEPSVEVRVADGEGSYLTECNQEDANGKDEIIIDVLKLKEMVTKSELLLTMIDVDGYKTKFKFDNVYGCHSGARAFVAECDRICALQACMEGIQINALDENIGHFDKEIDRAALEDLGGMKSTTLCP